MNPGVASSDTQFSQPEWIQCHTESTGTEQRKLLHHPNSLMESYTDGDRRPFGGSVGRVKHQHFNRSLVPACVVPNPNPERKQESHQCGEKIGR